MYVKAPSSCVELFKCLVSFSHPAQEMPAAEIPTKWSFQVQLVKLLFCSFFTTERSHVALRITLCSTAIP